MTNLRKWALMLLVCLIALEALSALVAFAWLRRIASTRSLFQTYAIRKETDNCSLGEHMLLHPYFAYRFHPNSRCPRANINSFGLAGRELPVVRPDDRYAILVLGGSVAQILAESTPNFVSPLEAELNRNYLSPTGKPFVVLNGAIAAGVQPMQSILFLLLHRYAHAVVSLEGYNERSGFGTERLEVTPGIWKDLDAASGANYRAVLWRSLASDLYERANSNLLFSRSYTAFAVTYALKRATLAHEQIPEALPPLPTEWDSKRRKDEFVESYLGYLRMIDSLAQAEAMKRAFFFQPVPALMKTLTDAEKAVVGDLTYGPRYREMVEMLERRSNGLPIFDLLDLLKDEKSSFYEDDIHFYQYGPANVFLAKTLAKRLATVWKLKSKQ